MARNYAEAEHELEPLLDTSDDSLSISRKLVICYTQTGKLDKALKLFNELITVDIEFILEADPVKDDCPCPELVENVGKFDLENSVDYLVLTGILWLFCDHKKSITYFQKAVAQSPENKAVAYAFNTIKDYFEKHPELI